MRFPLKSALQFASLDRKKQLLEGMLSARSAIRNHLLHKLVEFELSAARRQVFGPDEAPLAPGQVHAMLSFLLELDKPAGGLEADDLSRLHAFVCRDERDPLRTVPAQRLTHTHDPPDPLIIPRAIQRFFEWIQSPSFGEMHAVEQMTVSQMRLHEIHPFAEHSGLTISLFSYYFLLADDYLLPLYEESELPEFCAALEQAFAFSTEALIRFNTGACERAYGFVMEKETGRCL